MSMEEKVKIVIPLIGPHKGKRCEVIKVEMNAGAINGWFTVKLPSGKRAMYAGEELTQTEERGE